MRIVMVFITLTLSILTLSAQELDTLPVTTAVKVEFARKIAIDTTLEVEFVKVLSDSRCPKNVQCVWAGEAKILVKIYRNGVFDSEQELTISSRVIAATILEKLSSKLTTMKAIHLFPYPDIAVETSKNDYYIEFSIEQ